MSAQEKFDYDLTKLAEEMNPETTEQIEDILLEPVTQGAVPVDTQVSESIDMKDEAQEEEVQINQEQESQTKKPKSINGKKKRVVKQESKSISRIEEQLKTQSDQNKRINTNIRTMQKQLRELNSSRIDFAMHPVVKDQEQLKIAQRKIVELDRLVKSFDTNQTVIKNKSKGKKKKKSKGKKDKKT